MFRAVSLLVAGGFFLSYVAAGQTLEPTRPASGAEALTNPTYSPGVAFLFDLEAKFAADTAKGGGTAFAKWFADDAVTLSNGKAAVLGQPAIAADANWSPSDYELTWKPDGGRMSPAGTWALPGGTTKATSGRKTARLE